MHLMRPGVAGEKGFEGVEVVAVDDEVVIGACGVLGFGVVRDEGPVGDGQVVGVDVLLTLELQCGHALPPAGRLVARRLSQCAAMGYDGCGGASTAVVQSAYLGRPTA